MERYTQPDRQDIDFEIHQARSSLSDGYLVVYLACPGVGKTHYADIDFESYVVGGEGYQAGDMPIEAEKLVS